MNIEFASLYIDRKQFSVHRNVLVSTDDSDGEAERRTGREALPGWPASAALFDEVRVPDADARTHRSCEFTS